VGVGIAVDGGTFVQMCRRVVLLGVCVCVCVCVMIRCGGKKQEEQEEDGRMCVCMCLSGTYHHWKEEEEEEARLLGLGRTWWWCWCACLCFVVCFVVGKCVFVCVNDLCVLCGFFCVCLLLVAARMHVSGDSKMHPSPLF
jgi:hypothetical protein